MIDLPPLNRDELERKHVFVASDPPFRAHARLLQARWREEFGRPIGLHRGKPLGSRLAMPDAEERLTNFETENVRAIVRREIPLSDWSVPRAQRKLYARPRLFEDMLSSQPLCFNLFGELACDLGLATKVFGVLTKRRGLRVTGVDFEWSPGRGDARFTHDGSAFDVFVRTETHGKRASTASR